MVLVVVVVVVAKLGTKLRPRTVTAAVPRRLPANSPPAVAALAGHREQPRSSLVVAPVATTAAALSLVKLK